MAKHKRLFKVIDRLTGLIVFTGTKLECTQKIISDKTGFLELY